MVGRLSPILGSALSLALYSDLISGFVWIAGGGVVGNVTLQRADYSGNRWRISNVAVKKEFRRQGIARGLMMAALEEIELRGGGWAVLQVRTDNSVGRDLYRALGFSDVCQEGVWKLPLVPSQLPTPSDTVALQPLSGFAGRARLDLDRAAQTALAQWAEPIVAANYRTSLASVFMEGLSRFTDIRPLRRWGAWQDGRLDGQLEVRRGGVSHNLRFAVRPEARGKLEETLVSHGLRSLSDAPARSVVVKHSADHAEGVEALERFGFRASRILLTMRRRFAE